MGASYSISTKFTAIDRFSAVTDKFTSKVDKLTGKFAKLGALVGGLAIANEIKNANFELDKNLKMLSAITGVVGKPFEEFKRQINLVSQETRMFKGDVAKAFETVGNAQPTLLKDAKGLASVAKATIILSKASGEELLPTTVALTGVMNQFNLSSDQANRTINALAAGSVAGNANIQLINEAMVNFGAVAAGANVSLEQSIALIEVLSMKGILGAEAGTKLRGALIKLQKSGLGYTSGAFKINDALDEMRKKFDSLTTAKQKDAYLLNVFGLENITAGRILLTNIDLFKQYTKDVTGTSTAYTQAAINGNSFNAIQDRIVNSFKNFVTSTDESNKVLTIAKSLMLFVANNMNGILTVLLMLIAAYATYRTILILTQAAQIGYNIVLGLSAALAGKSAFAVHGNTVAYGAYRTAVVVATAAQWLWNAAMSANPIGLIIIGIAALIGLVVLMTKKWDDWGASIALLFGPIGMLISFIMELKDRWDYIKEAFTAGGILNGLKAIGKTLLSALIKPFESFLRLLAKIPFLTDKLQPAIDRLNNFREGMFDDQNAVASVNPDAANQNATKNIMQQWNGNLNVGVKAEPGTQATVWKAYGVTPSVSNTSTFKR